MFTLNAVTGCRRLFYYSTASIPDRRAGIHISLIFVKNYISIIYHEFSHCLDLNVYGCLNFCTFAPKYL